MATHSSVLAWRIPGTGEPGGLPSMGSHRNELHNPCLTCFIGDSRMILEHGEDAECRVAEPWADSTLPGCGRLERIRLGTPSCWLFNRPLCVGSTCIPNLSTLSANHRQLPRGWVSSSVGHLSPGVCWFPSDRKSTRLNSSHTTVSRMPSSA